MLTHYTRKRLEEEQGAKDSNNQVQEQVEHPTEENKYEFSEEFTPQVEREQVEEPQAKFDEKPKKK